MGNLKLRRLQLDVREDFARYIDERVAALGITRSQLIRKAIKLYCLTSKILEEEGGLYTIDKNGERTEYIFPW